MMEIQNITFTITFIKFFSAPANNADDKMDKGRSNQMDHPLHIESV